MSTVFPIRVVNTERPKEKYIEWKLTNVCNYDCSFCSAKDKQGNEQWLGLDFYKRVVDQLVSANKDSILLFHLTGGEPTLNPELLDLIKYIKSLGGQIELMTNGSAPLKWYAEVAAHRLIDNLIIGVHVEQSIDLDYILKIIKLFDRGPITVFCYVTAPPSHFDQALAAHKRILTEASWVMSFLKPIFVGWESDNHLADYTDEQLSILQRNVMIKDSVYKKEIVTYPEVIELHMSDQSVQMVYPYTLLAQGLNQYKGWECDIGQNAIIIDHTKIYRSLCRVGGVIGDAQEHVLFVKDSVICPNDRCVCGHGLQENKRRI